MQLSVERYQAIAVDRGASLDTLDYPLNNRLWLEEQFARIRKLHSDAGAAQGDRGDPAMDQSGARRVLRRPGQYRLPAAFAARTWL